MGARLPRSGARPCFIDNAIAHQYFEKTPADLIRDAEAFADGDVRLARKHPGVVIEGQLYWLAREPRWKQRLLRMAAAFPAIADLGLAPLCACGELCFPMPAARNLGVRAL